MHHLLDGDDFSLFLDSIQHENVSIVGFGTGVKTGAAMASRCASRVTGFVGVGGSTMDYYEIDTWRERRDKLQELAKMSPSARGKHVRRLFHGDKAFADRLSMWDLEGKLQINLDVIVNSMSRHNAPYLGKNVLGVFAGPSMFVLPDNCNELPLATCTLPIRNNFLGLHYNLRDIHVLPSLTDDLHQTAPVELARLLRKFWRWNDGVRAEYVHRGEVDAEHKVWPVGEEPKMPFYPYPNESEGKQYTGFHKAI